MAQFNVPSESQKYSAVVETFRGVDLNNSPSNVDKSRSPAAPNMIRDQVGKVRKRMGYETKVTATGGAAINGVHHLLEETLVHAGTKLYRLFELIKNLTQPCCCLRQNHQHPDPPRGCTPGGWTCRPHHRR